MRDVDGFLLNADSNEARANYPAMNAAETTQEMKGRCQRHHPLLSIKRPALRGRLFIHHSVAMRRLRRYVDKLNGNTLC